MSLAGVDLNLLVVLDALLRESSVTRAAKRLGLSQSATSHALARLRRLLDDPVLVRTPHGMAPTPRAAGLAAPVQQALEQLEQSLAPPRPFDPSRSTLGFTLSLEDAGQVGLLPLLAERLKTEAPHVDLRVHSAGTGSPTEALETATVDLALAVSPEPTEGFHAEVVFTTRYVSIVRADHPHVGRRLTRKRFSELGHIVLGGPGSVDPEIDRVLAASSRSRRAALTVPSLLPIPWLVARTDLVATVPALLLGLDRERLPLARHVPPIPIDSTTGSLVWHERTHRDAAHRWLRGVVREVCRELAARGLTRARSPADLELDSRGNDGSRRDAPG
ncbi:MAG: LysR family transcriptional regulator [Myxococcota bacterium]